MSNKFSSRETVERLRKECPEGTRIELISINDPYNTLRPGGKGTVLFVDDIGSLAVNWDNGYGSSLSVA